MIIEDKDYESPFGDVFTSGLRHQKIDSNTYGNFNTEEFLFHYNEFLSAYDKIFNEAIKDSKRHMAYWTKEDFASLAKKLDDNDGLKKKAEELIAYYQRSGVKQAIPELPSLIDFINKPNANHGKLSPRDLVQIHEKIVNHKAQLDPFQPYWEKLNANQWKNSRGLAAIRSQYQQDGSNFSVINSEGTRGKEAVLATLRNNKMLKWVHSKEDYDKNIAKGQPTFYEENGIFHIHYGQQSPAAFKERCNETLIGARKALQKNQITVFDNIEKPVEFNYGAVLMEDAQKKKIETTVFGLDTPLPPGVKRNVDAKMAVINERGAYDLKNGQRVTKAGYRKVDHSEVESYQERYTDVLLDEKNKHELKRDDDQFHKKPIDTNLTSKQKDDEAQICEKVAKSLGYHSVRFHDEAGEFKEVRVFHKQKSTPVYDDNMNIIAQNKKVITQEDKDLFDFSVNCEKNKESEKRVEILSKQQLEALLQEINITRTEQGQRPMTSVQFYNIVGQKGIELRHQFVLSKGFTFYQKSMDPDRQTKAEEFKQAIKNKTVDRDEILLVPTAQFDGLVSLKQDVDLSSGEEKRMSTLLCQQGFSVRFFDHTATGCKMEVYHQENTEENTKKIDNTINLIKQERLLSANIIFDSGKIKKGLKDYNLTPDQIESLVAVVAQEKGLILSYTEQEKGHDKQIGKFTVSAPKDGMDQDSFIHAVQKKANVLYEGRKPSVNANLFNAANNGLQNADAPKFDPSAAFRK